MAAAAEERMETEKRIKQWVCIYPTYINSKRTLAEGRRIPKDKAVETPTSQEISDILKSAGLNVFVETKKMYPRDQNRDLTFQGRVRVQLKNDDGSLANHNFPTRESVMLHAAELIPKLKSRLQRSAAGGAQDGGAANAPQKGAQKQKKKR